MISVVIPLFNKSNTIIFTLNSVLKQTFKEFEVIIIDDGSTDDSLKQVNRIVDNRIRIISQKNKGVSVARNRGVYEAVYEYIAFLDGDDEWETGYLAKMIKAISLYPETGMYCCAGTIRNPEGIYYRLAEQYKNRILEINFFENPHVFLHTSATIVKKKLFNKVGGFPIGMKRNQDYALFYSMAFYGKVVYCGFPLSVYVGSVGGQATSTPFSEVVNHVVNRYDFVHKQWLKTHKCNQHYLVFLKYELRHTILVLLRSRDYTTLRIFISNLDEDIIKQLGKVESRVYDSHKLLSFKLIYIILTKLRWRLRGYPRISYKKPAIRSAK